MWFYVKNNGKAQTHKMSQTEKTKKPVIVAQIMGKWIGGGVESVIMNYYRHLDHTKVQFDFICDEDSTRIPYDEIKKLGGRVFLVPKYQKLPKYLKALEELFRKNHYRIVHSNVNTLSVFPLYAAKKAGVPVRISHSHSTSNPKEWKRNIIKNILRPFSKKYATDYFACSELAGRYLFGDKAFDQGKVKIIHNAIDLDKFKFDLNARKKLRKEFGIKDSTTVIGHVGRFVQQKNHTFLVDVFKRYHKKNPDSKLLLIGSGPLENKIKKKVEKLGLKDSVLFLGQRDDTNKLYSIMDVFCLPSLYEGLGVVGIEAQAAGLLCIFSKDVPIDVKISKKAVFEERNITLFVKQIKLNVIKNHQEENVEAYNIKKEVKNLENFYTEKRKKKVAIISSGFLPVPAVKGGAVENLIEILIDKNEEHKEVNFEIISTFDQAAKDKAVLYQYTKILYINPNFLTKFIDVAIFMICKMMKKKQLHSYRYIAQRLEYLYKVSLILNRNDYDIVLLENHPTQFLALKWSKNYKKYKNKYFYHSHNELPGLYGCDKVVKGTNKILCVSEFIAKRMQTQANISSKQTSVVRNCINEKKFQLYDDIAKREIREKFVKKYKINHNKIILLFSGRITEEKGIDKLLAALKNIDKNKFFLIIIGAPLFDTNISTEFEQKIKREVAELGSENCAFTGFVQYEEVSKYYAGCDICVIPSIWDDPAPLTVIESLKSGVPIISTKSGGIPEYLKPQAGFLLDKDLNLIEELSKAIQTLINNTEKRKQMAKAAQKNGQTLSSDEYYYGIIKELK